MLRREIIFDVFPFSFACPIQELEGAEVREPSDDYLSAFNCLLCYYALGDRDRMRNGFLRMLQMKLPVGDEDRYLNLQDDPQVRRGQEEGIKGRVVPL